MGVRQWVRSWFTGRSVEPLDPARDDLLVVVSSFDDVEACSAALARAGRWRAAEQAVLRHHLLLPPGVHADAVATAAQDGYAVGAGSPDELVLQRVQVLDALHCAQERSRMAGLAQRLDGHVRGWDALQPPAGPGDG